MKQPDKRTPFLFITLGIVTILLLLIDMATGDTYIPIKAATTTRMKRIERRIFRVISSHSPPLAVYRCKQYSRIRWQILTCWE